MGASLNRMKLETQQKCPGCQWRYSGPTFVYHFCSKLPALIPFEDSKGTLIEWPDPKKP